MERLNSEKVQAEEIGILDNNSEWLGIPKSHLMECAGYSFATEIVQKYKLGENLKIEDVEVRNFNDQEEFHINENSKIIKI